MTDGSGAVHRLGLGATLVPFCKRPPGTRAEQDKQLTPSKHKNNLFDQPRNSKCGNAENRLVVTLRWPGSHQDARATETKRYKHEKKRMEKEGRKQASR